MPPSITDPLPHQTDALRSRRERRRDRSRDDILAAARLVLLRDGIGAVTLEGPGAE